MRASTSRFSAIASDRAPTIASVIQTRSCADGRPCTARNAPTYANGSAKTVCSILTRRANRAGSGASVGADAVMRSVALLVRDVNGTAEQLEHVRENRPQ